MFRPLTRGVVGCAVRRKRRKLRGIPRASWLFAAILMLFGSNIYVTGRLRLSGISRAESRGCFNGSSRNIAIPTTIIFGYQYSRCCQLPAFLTSMSRYQIHHRVQPIGSAKNIFQLHKTSNAYDPLHSHGRRINSAD